MNAESLSGGQAAGIAFGYITGMLLVAAIIYLFVNRKNVSFLGAPQKNVATLDEYATVASTMSIPMRESTVGKTIGPFPASSSNPSTMETSHDPNTSRASQAFVEPDDTKVIFSPTSEPQSFAAAPEAVPPVLSPANLPPPIVSPAPVSRPVSSAQLPPPLIQSTTAPVSSHSPIVSPAPQAGMSAAGAALAADFFKKVERVPMNESEAVTISRSEAFIRSRPDLLAKIPSTLDADVIVARFCRVMTMKIMSEKISEITIYDLQKNPTRFVDALVISSCIESMAATTLQFTLADFEAQKNKRKTLDPIRCSVEVAEDQGPRPYMEDRCIVQKHAHELVGLPDPLAIFGVLDGHGGTIVADYCKVNLHINTMRDEAFQLDIREAVREAFLSTNERYFSMLEREPVPDGAGATAVLAMVSKYALTVAWAGDSEAVLFKRDGSFIPCCVPHKPWMENEKRRIEEMGGFVSERNGVGRVMGALAVARAFGDAKYRRYITAEPDIVQLPLDGTESYLIVACDGLWDVIPKDKMAAFVYEYTSDYKPGLANALASWARQAGSTDNVSVIVIRFG